MAQVGEMPQDADESGVRVRTRLDPDERRSQILDVASEVFRDQEYSAVSLEAIASRAGVTRGLLHHYFGSKRALYLEVVEHLVRIPADAVILPAGASGDLREVLAVSVKSWMSMVKTVGGMWAGVAGSGGFGTSDVDEVLDRARDDLVDRMIAEFPFPEELEEKALRSALRCYAAAVRVAIDEWLVHRTLRRDQTEALLLEMLLTLVERVVPAMNTRPGVTGS